MDLQHEQRLTEVEERSKSNTKRLDEYKKKQDDLLELVGAVKVLATREEQVETDVKEIKADVKSLTQKPAQKWEKAVTTVLTTIIAAVVGFMLAKIGL